VFLKGQKSRIKQGTSTVVPVGGIKTLRRAVETVRPLIGLRRFQLEKSIDTWKNEAGYEYDLAQYLKDISYQDGLGIMSAREGKFISIRCSWTMRRVCSDTVC